MSLGSLTLACLLALSPTGGDTYFINQQQIRIPISIDPTRRSEIKEMHLFVSADEGKSWDQRAVASPDQDAFSFFAPKDGMYWFSVVVVNQQNQKEPNDLYGVPPSQKIVIDTQKPSLRIRTADRQGDDATVAWEIHDDYPDWSSLRLEYRAAGASTAQWIPVPVTAAPNGQAKFRPQIPGPIMVRMQMQDLAGSFSTADAELAAGPAAQMQLDVRTAGRQSGSTGECPHDCTDSKCLTVNHSGVAAGASQPVSGYRSCAFHARRAVIDEQWQHRP